MTPETAKRYVKVRQDIEILVDRIHAIGNLMSLLKDANGAVIDHLTAAWIGSRIKTDVLMILSLLDDFAYIQLDEVKEIDDQS